MTAVFEDKKKRVIRGLEEIKFNSRSSRHLISVTARVKSKKQIAAGATDDEDLTIELDGKKFSTLTAPQRFIDSPALHVLNNDKSRPTEYEAYSGKAVWERP